MTPDLTLPPSAPQLCTFTDCAWDDASFALYTLLPNTPLQEIASSLEKQWRDQGNTTHLVQPAPNASHSSLKDIVAAHIALDKGLRPRTDGGAKADLTWWPTGFLVVVREEWKEVGGLLFVYADEEKEGRMGRFAFRVEDAYMMLSSLVFGDEEVGRCAEVYGVGGDGDEGGKEGDGKKKEEGKDGKREKQEGE